MTVSRLSLEVVATYRGVVLDVQHLEVGGPPFTVGEGHDASFVAPPVDLRTPEAFELARFRRGGAWIRFSSDMPGDVTMRGRRYTLRQWVDAGWAIADEGAWGTTLREGARCRIRHGDVTFHIAVVASACRPALSSEVDAPFWWICAATLVVLGSLLYLAHRAMPNARELDLAHHPHANRFVGYVRAPDARPRQGPRRSPPRSSTPTTVTRAEVEGPVAKSVSVESAIDVVSPRGVSRSGTTRAAGARVRTPPRRRSLGSAHSSAVAALMQRGDGPIERARHAGVLAFVDTRPLVENEYAGAFSPDADDKAMWEAQRSIDPTTRSVAGLDLIGKGRGGGPGSADDLVRTVSRVDDDANVGVAVRLAHVRGPRSRASVQKIIDQYADGIRGCVRRSGTTWRGGARLVLDVDAAGTVVNASTDGIGDASLGRCVAGAARRWNFGARDRRPRARVTVSIFVE